MKHRIPALVAALALVALAIPLIAGVASAAPTAPQPAQVENSYPVAYALLLRRPFRRVLSATATPPQSGRPHTSSTPLPMQSHSVTPTPTLIPCSSPTIPPTTPPTATPAQSEQGQTASTVTPPPTSTGSNGSSNSSMPLFALLICARLRRARPGGGYNAATEHPPLGLNPGRLERRPLRDRIDGPFSRPVVRFVPFCAEVRAAGLKLDDQTLSSSRQGTWAVPRIAAGAGVAAVRGAGRCPPGRTARRSRSRRASSGATAAGSAARSESSSA